MRLPKIDAGVARGLAQVCAPYALLIPVVAAAGAYTAGVTQAPTPHAQQPLPSWSTPFFSTDVGITTALMIGLLVPNYDDLRVWTVGVTFALMVAGIVFCCLALAEVPSRALYPQVVGVASAGVASGVTTVLVLALGNAITRQRRIRRKRREAIGK